MATGINPNILEDVDTVVHSFRDAGFTQEQVESIVQYAEVLEQIDQLRETVVSLAIQAAGGPKVKEQAAAKNGQSRDYEPLPKFLGIVGLDQKRLEQHDFGNVIEKLENLRTKEVKAINDYFRRNYPEYDMTTYFLNISYIHGFYQQYLVTPRNMYEAPREVRQNRREFMEHWEGTFASFQSYGNTIVRTRRSGGKTVPTVNLSPRNVERVVEELLEIEPHMVPVWDFENRKIPAPRLTGEFDE